MKKALINLIFTAAFFNVYSQILDKKPISVKDVFTKVRLDTLLQQDLISLVGKEAIIDSAYKSSFGRLINVGDSLNIQTDSVGFTNVNFPIPIIFISKHNKITSLSFIKKYSSIDSVYRSKILNRDFDKLKKYFSEKYNSQFEIRGIYSDPRYYRDAAKWKIKKQKIDLIRHYGELIGENNLFTSYLEILFH